jgi:hypothetical protein
MNESEQGSVTSIYPVNTRISFRPEEAEPLIDLFLKITRKSRTIVVNLKSRIQYFQGRKDKISEIQDEINQEVQKWSEKVIKLGGVPVSLWKVRIPGVGEKDYVWEFPKSHFI